VVDQGRFMRSCSPNKSRSSYYNKKFLNRKGTQKIQALVVVLLVILCDTLKAPMLFSAAWQKISCQSGWTNRKRLMLIQHGASYSKYRVLFIHSRRNSLYAMLHVWYLGTRIEIEGARAVPRVEKTKRVIITRII